MMGTPHHSQPHNEQATTSRWFFFVPYALRLGFEGPIGHMLVNNLLVTDFVKASLTSTKYIGEIPGCDSPVVSNMIVSFLRASQLLMGGPSAGDQTQCPVLTMPVTLRNGRQCIYPLQCLQTFVKHLCIFVIDSISAYPPIPQNRTITALCLERSTFTESILKVHYFMGNLATTCINTGQTAVSCSTQNIFIQQNKCVLLLSGWS
jgi:hypothetical protein